MQGFWTVSYLRGNCTSHQNLVCFVRYLKLSEKLKNGAKILGGQTILSYSPK